MLARLIRDLETGCRAARITSFDRNQRTIRGEVMGDGPSQDLNRRQSRNCDEDKQADWVRLDSENIHKMIEAAGQWIADGLPGGAFCLCCGQAYSEAEMVPGTNFHDCPEQRAQNGT